MSQDPKTNPPPKAQAQESLEDLVYRSSLSAGNRSLHGASKAVTLPVTLCAYAAFGFAGVQLAKHTEAGKKIVKTMGVSLTEENEAPPPPPPPPPPAPAAPAAPAPKLQMKEAPPPPPVAPGQESVPEVAPRELPKEDLTLRYAGQASSGTTGTGVVGAGTGPSTMTVAGSGTAHVVDFDFSQMKIKYQPPAPPYPPLAKIARIQGTVVVEITVGPDGIPISAHAIEGPPQLRQVAESYAMGWKFEPAMLNGVAQTARFRLTMPFKLR